MTNIEIADITIDSRVQLKQRKTDESTVRDYVEALSAGAEFPPVILYRQNGISWLADGFHRIAAHRFLGRTEIQADVRDGDKNDAIVYAATAHLTASLSMSQAQNR